MIRLKHILFAVMAALLAAACIRYDIPAGWPADSGEQGVVSFTLSTPGVSVPHRSRALTVAQERDITDVDVLAFYATGVDAGKLHVIAAAGAPNLTNPARPTFQVVLPTGTFHLMILGNARNVLTAAGLATNATLTRDNVADALVKSLSAGSKWTQTQIPFFGYVQNVVVNSTTSLTGSNAVDMHRMVAKIDVSMTSLAQSTFTLESIHLCNYNTAGQIVPDSASWNSAGNVAALPSEPSAPGKQTGLANALLYQVDGDGFTATGVERTIYTFEVANGTAATKSTNPCIIVGGDYNSSGSTSYYRLDFVDSSGDPIDILRNHLYAMNIRKVTGAGYPTAQEAFDGGSFNIEANVVQWVDGGIVDINFDGNIHFGISARSVLISAQGNPLTVTIETNDPNFVFKLGSVELSPAGSMVQTTTWNQYTLTPLGGEHYSITIVPNSANVSTTPGPSRMENWTIVTGKMELSFTVDQDWSSSYFRFWWYRAAFNGSPAGTYLWNPGQYSDGSMSYIFPWNTAVIEFDIASDDGITDASTTSGLGGGTLTIGTGTPAGAGVTNYPLTFTLNPLSYAIGRNYSLLLTTASASTSQTVSFSQTAQNLTFSPLASTSFGYTAATTSTTLSYNVNWSANSSAGSWLTMRKGTSGAYGTSDSETAGRITSPQTNRPAMNNSETIGLQIASIGTLNALSSPYSRTGTVTVTNDDRDPTKGGAANATISITQYSPTLVSGGTTLPVSPTKIPQTGGTYTVTATTNLQGWGVRVYTDYNDNGTPNAGTTPIITQPFGPSPTISADTAPSNRNVNITVSAYTGTAADRKLTVKLYCTEFPATEITVGTWEQWNAFRPTLSVPSTALSWSYSQSGNASGVDIAVTSNTTWNVSVPAGFAATPTTGSGNGSFRVYPSGTNSLLTPQTGTVTVSTTFGTNDTSSGFNVTQAGGIPTLTLTPAATLEWASDKFGSGEGKSITVTSNTSWTANAPSNFTLYNASTGATGSTVSDSGNGTLWVYPTTKNEDQTDRTGNVTVTTTVGSPQVSATAAVKQGVAVNPSSVEIVVNGTTWASSNAGGGDASNYGLLWQWGTNNSYSAGQNSPMPPRYNGDTWPDATSPCPTGYSLPTRAQLADLANTAYVSWTYFTTPQGIVGWLVSPTSGPTAGQNCFFPATGFIHHDGYHSFYTTGVFLSCSESEGLWAWALEMVVGYSLPYFEGIQRKSQAWAVRCVQNN